MGPSPISWRATAEYAEVEGLDYDETRSLWLIIRDIDQEFLPYLIAKMEAKSKPTAPPPETPTRRGLRRER